MSEVSVAPVLTREEDSFALAVIEYGGNIGAAYNSVFGETRGAGSKARDLLARPEIAKRITELNDMIQRDLVITLGSHLVQLAKIRDLAVASDQMKVALDAEVKRGEVAGFYNSAAPVSPNAGVPAVQINFNSPTPVTVKDWSAKHSTGEVVDVTVKQST